MAITRERFARNGAFSGNATATFGSNITAGRSLVIIASTSPVAPPGTAGTVSGAARVAGGAVSNGFWHDLFLYNNHPGGTAAVTYVPGEASGFTTINVWEVSVGAALELENWAAQYQASAGTGANAVTSGSQTATDGSLVVGQSASDAGAGLTAGTGFSTAANNGAVPSGGGGSPLQYFGAESQVKSGTASLAVTFTAAGNDNWSTVMVIARESGTTVTGSGAVTLDALQVSGAGARTITGSGAILLPVIEVAGDGGVSGEVTGAGDISLAELQVAGSGFRSAIGSGSIVLSALEASGAGVVEGVTIGSGSIALPVLGVSGQGFRTATGTGSILLPVLEVLGFGDGAEGDQDILARDSRRRGRVMLIFGRG